MMPDVSIIEPRFLLARRPRSAPAPTPPATAAGHRAATDPDQDDEPYVAPLFGSRLIPLTAMLLLSLGLWAGIIKLGAMLF